MKNGLFILILLVSTSCKSVQQENSNRIIQLTKKRCLGKCPVYDVFIDKEGMLSYNGIDNVEKKGIYKIKITDKELRELQLLFSEARFEELKNSRKKGRDLPITQLSYHRKTVSFHGQQMPQKVKEIIRKIEGILKK